MKYHLIFILLFIVVVPVWTISLIWNTMVENENDAVRYRFGLVLEERLEKISEQSLGILNETAEELKKIDKQGPDDLVNDVLFFDSSGQFSQTRAAPNNIRPESALFAQQLFKDRLQKRDTKTDEAPRMGSIINGNVSLITESDYGWAQKMGSPDLDLWFWHFLDDDEIKIIDVKTEYLIEKISALPLPVDINPYDGVVLADGKERLVHLWGAQKPVENNATPRASVSMPFPMNTMQLYYFTDNFPTINLKFRILILSVACSLCIMGGYFFWEHMRSLDATMQKVSFVNQVSHELKTPLTNIRMYVDLLKSSLSDDVASTKKLEIIDHEAIRLSRLINNVLTFSNQKNLQLNPAPCDVDVAVNRILESFLPQLESQGFKIETDYKAGTYIVDQEMLAQIAINLISNAQKYASSGKYLGIQTFIEDEKLHLKISDKGPGIAEKLQENIFKPFVRGDDKATEGVSGTGLGLYLVKDLTERQHGELILNSDKNGTTFEVIL